MDTNLRPYRSYNILSLRNRGFSFTSQILDNADGKQARTTGNSSVLGMLFDHGCDAITSYFLVCLVLCLTRGVYFHDGFPMIVQLLCVFNGFYCAMMEAYFLGGVTLPPFNGPNEGILMIASLGPVTYIYGKPHNTQRRNLF